MNENDSEKMAGALEALGLCETPDICQADVILVNTCSVRDTAERKANGFISLLKKIKEKNPLVLLGITGCMAKREGEALLKKYRFVDFVLGPDEEIELSEIVCKIQNPKSKIQIKSKIPNPKPQIIKRKGAVRAWVTVMEGCDNFCSFCIVPYVRGREKSRTFDEIIAEIEGLDKNIFKEVMLLGQNVNSYEYGFASLLSKVAKIDGILRVRFMTSHPKDMTAQIIDAVAENKKICEAFHLPLQSGDNEVLKRMNRGYTREYYRQLIQDIRRGIPDASITSDVIAGFPGETEEQFQNTLDLIKELELDSVITAAYDPRPGTAAEKMEGQLPFEVKKERLARLVAIVKETALKKNKKLEGSIVEILIEEKGFGRTRTYKIVRFNGTSPKAGELAGVKINQANSWVLNGELIT
jgi:tRNA-2-methylthio-N6-dimethylallyladenosine synthase